MGTSVASQKALMSFGLQTAKIGEGGTFTVGDVTWNKILAAEVAMGAVQEMGMMSNQVGGILTPTGAFKQMVMSVGQFTTFSRLQSSLGILLKGLMGTASSVLDKDVNGTTVTGLNTHIFRFNPADQSAQPWMAFRNLVPGSTPLGEIFYDCKIDSATIQMPPKGKLMSQFSFVGRDYVRSLSPSWTYANANFDNDQSAPDSGRGTVSFGGVTYPLMGASLQIQNSLSAEQESIIGSYRMDDLIALSRAATLKVIVKWEDGALYNKVFNGGASALTFDPLPFTQDTVGAASAVKLHFSSPVNVPSTSPLTPYGLTIRASRAVWTTDGPIQLQGGAVLSQAYTITLLEPASGEDYLQVILENAVASY